MMKASRLTFVCCVESGSLENQTVRMVRSLRQHGGRFADAAVVAVTPRFGPPLSKSTREAFDRFEVTHFRHIIKNDYPWFRFLNKPMALLAAEEHIRSEAIAFLDSDLLIVDEPEQLDLRPFEDFLGFPVECKEMGTIGPGDPYEPIWREFCRIVGINIDDLPWITTAETNQRVRLYFNGGIFVYRQSTGFAKSYLDTCLKLLDSRIGTRAPDYAEGLKEMSAIGFTIVKLGLKWQPLPYSHDYVMMSKTHSSWYKEELLREARIVHYHDSMWPYFFPVFIRCLHDTHPEVAQWVTSLGPMRNEAPPQWRFVSKMLMKMRARAENTYRRRCLIV